MTRVNREQAGDRGSQWEGFLLSIDGASCDIGDIRGYAQRRALSITERISKIGHPSSRSWTLGNRTGESYTS